MGFTRLCSGDVCPRGRKPYTSRVSLYPSKLGILLISSGARSVTMGDRAGLPAELGISKDPSKLVSSPDSSLRISFLLMKRSLLSPIPRFLLVETTGTMGCVRGVCNVSSGDSLPLVFSRSVDNKSWTDRGTSYVKDNPTPGSSIGLSPRVTGERRGVGDPPDPAVDDVTRAPFETETTGRNSSSPPLPSTWSGEPVELKLPPFPPSPTALPPALQQD